MHVEAIHSTDTIKIDEILSLFSLKLGRAVA